MSKPDVPVLRRADYEVRVAPLATAQEMVREHHYARGGSNTAVAVHGLYLRTDPDRCLGVAWWLPPTKVAAQSVSEEWQSVLSLTRLVVLPEVPQNGATFLLGQSIKLLRLTDPRWKTLLTYADEGQGHFGMIYRATNWVYLGKVPGSGKWFDADGRQVAAKSTVNRTKAEMIERGYIQQKPTPKHKYKLVIR